MKKLIGGGLLAALLMTAGATDAQAFGKRGRGGCGSSGSTAGCSSGSSGYYVASSGGCGSTASYAPGSYGNTIGFPAVSHAPYFDGSQPTIVYGQPMYTQGGIVYGQPTYTQPLQPGTVLTPGTTTGATPAGQLPPPQPRIGFPNTSNYPSNAKAGEIWMMESNGTWTHRTDLEKALPQK